ncbi:MAG: hypothetical protein Q9220_003351 [cf. Caloplaca sp. 1 TL-2023]
MSWKRISFPLVLFLLLIETHLVLGLVVPPRNVGESYWDEAVKKGTALLGLINSGCVPDVVHPITREEMVAIGFRTGDDVASSWPPSWGGSSTFDEVAVKMFKWTIKKNAYWNTTITRHCNLVSTPWQDETSYRYEFSPRNGLLTSLGVKRATADTLFWTDATFAMWDAVTRISGNNIRNLKFIAHHSVHDISTQTIISRITGGLPGKIKVFGQETESFAALLGTPYGISTAHLLMQHKRQLGFKVIPSVAVFGKTQQDWSREGPDIIYEFREGSPPPVSDGSSTNATFPGVASGLCRELADVSGTSAVS